ncbi:MAG: tetratricopeptide repeat protein [Acidobacteriota bacterium]
MLALPEPPAELVTFLRDAAEATVLRRRYLRTAIAEGHLERGAAGRWRLSPSLPAGTSYGDLPLPRVRDVVARRISRLAPQARLLADAAAILGDDLEESHIGAVASLPEAGARDGIVELIALQVLDEQGGGRLGFVHAKIREVALAEISEERSAGLHRQAAGVLEGDPEWRSLRPFAIASHWEGAGEPLRAAPLYRVAAENALARFALDQAEGLHRSYLRVAPPDEEAVRMRLALAELVLAKKGDTAGAMAEAREAHETATRAGSRVAQARSLREIGRQLQVNGDVREARRVLDEARAAFAEVGDATGIGSVAISLGDLADAVGDKTGAERFYAEAREVFERGTDRRRLGACLSRLADISMEMRRDDEALDLYVRALQIHRELGDVSNECITLGNLASLHVQRGEPDQARRLFGQAIEIVLRVGDRPNAAIMLLNLGTLCQMQGGLEEARAHYDQALALCRDTGTRRIEAIALGMRASCRRALGERNGVREELEESLGLMREVGDRWNEPVALEGLALLEPDGAERARALARAASLHREVGNRAGRGMVLVRVAEAEMDLGRFREARSALDEAIAESRAVDSRWGIADACLALARLERETGMPGSEKALGEAQRIYEELGMLLHAARCHCERARLVASRGGDPVPHTSHASEICALLGLPAGSDLAAEIARAGRRP